MALADLAVEFKLRGASEAQRQVDALGGSFSKLGGTIDHASGMVRSSIGTMMGMLSAGAIQRIASSVADSVKTLAGLPNELMKGRMEISKSRSELLHAGMGVYDTNEIEKRARTFTNEYAGITSNAYMQAMYEMQSSIPEATMKTKQRMAETALLTASVTSATNEDMAKLFAKAVHSLRAVGKSEEEIIGRMQNFGGKIKQAVDVGVFRGPDMLEALKQTIPVWLQRGASDSEMVGLNTFLMTQGFDASTSGVYSREMAQRLPKAMAAAELSRRIYDRTGSEEAVRKSIDNAGKYKSELFKIQSDMERTGLFTSGPTKMLDNYRQSLDKIPKVLADKLRLKYTHEHLDPGLLAIFGGWDNFKRMMGEVEKGNFGSLLDAYAAKSKEFAMSASLMEQRIKNLKDTAGQGFEHLLGPVRDWVSSSARDIQQALEKHMPEITGYFRGLNAGIKEAIGLNPLDSWMQSFKDMFAGESGFSAFIKGEASGKQIGEALQPWVKSFSELGASAFQVSSGLQQIKSDFKALIDLVSGSGDILDRIGRFLSAGGQHFRKDFIPMAKAEGYFDRTFGPKEGETDEEYRARVIEERKRTAAEYSINNPTIASPLSVMRELLEYIGIMNKREQPQPQMPTNIGLSGTLRIEGNTGSINASGKPNTANAMGQ